MNDDELLERIEKDYLSAGLDDRRRAMLAYVEKLTRAPASMVCGDVEVLRAAGLGDADILAIVEVASYYAYVNRIANGLGVDLESP